MKRTTPPPVKYLESIAVPTARSDIRPYAELTTANLSTMQVLRSVSVDKSLSVDDVTGKYVNRHLKSGERITRDMLIEKPTTERIVEFRLKEGTNGQVVFSDVYQYLTRDPKFVHTIPFDCQHSSSHFNGALPDWTRDYIQAVQQRLQEKSYEEWTMEEVNLLWSISDICFYHERKSSLDLAGIGEQLAKLVEQPSDIVWADSAARDARHSALILGEAVRLNGSLPPQVLNLQPENEAVVAKLDLLKTMAENQADDHWIQQERRRLYGLLEEAPVQALKILFTAKPINGHNNLESWIFALSTEQTRDAWRSSPTEDFSPPVDPVLVVAVAELLVGKDEVTDNNLALVFEQDHPGYMFSRHLDDLLSSDLAYRDTMLESLVTIYRFSKSTALKANIARVAPSVPVLARKLDGDVGLLMDKNHEAVHFANTYPLRRDAESLYRFLRDSSVTGVSISTLSTNTCFALHVSTQLCNSFALRIRSIYSKRQIPIDHRVGMVLEGFVLSPTQVVAESISTSR